VGNAGNITAYWKGFKEYYSLGKIKKLPKLLGFQAEGAAPLVLGHPIENPKTIATAIRIGNPASGERALEAIRESQGKIDTVSDEEIIDAQKELANKEGIFVEPASAASWAGVKKLIKNHKLEINGEIVCVLTGNGLKDPDTILNNIKIDKEIEPNIEDLKRVLEE
jgi:threonine synthase